MNSHQGANHVNNFSAQFVWYPP